MKIHQRNSKVDLQAEKKIIEFEDRAIEITESEEQKEKEFTENVNRALRDL